MKIKSIILGTLLAGASLSSAVTLKVLSGANDTLAFSDGTTGAMTIIVGYYNVIPNFGITSPSVAYSTFQPVHTFNYDGETAGIPGNVGNTTTTELTVDPWTGSNAESPVIGKKIYAWVFKPGFEGNFDSLSSQYGLFNQSNTFLQSDGPAPQDSSVSFTDVTTNYTQVQYGSVVDANPASSGSAQFRLAQVPEPSTAVLGLLAGLGLVARRRRA